MLTYCTLVDIFLMNRTEKVLQDEVFRIVKPICFKGIEGFFDIATLLKDSSLLLRVLNSLGDTVERLKPTVVCVLDARGFLFGTTVATRLRTPLVMIRKAGKLPGDCIRVVYNKEYESGDVLEIQKGSILESDRVVVIDDILATGGSMAAAFDLVRSLNPQSVVGVCLIDLNLPGSQELMRNRSVSVVPLFNFSEWKATQTQAYPYSLSLASPNIYLVKCRARNRYIS